MTDVPRWPHDDVRLDLPFRPDFELVSDQDLGLLFDLPAAKDAKYRCVRNALLIALWSCRFELAWLTYSRDRNTFTAWRHYYGKPFSCDRVLAVVDELDSTQIIIHQRMKPSSNNRFRSRIRFANDIDWQSLAISPNDIRQTSFEVLRLKDSSKRLTRYRENEFTQYIRADIDEQNEMLSSIDIGFDTVDNFHEESTELHRIGNVLVNLKRRLLYRVFNVDWLHGGRWYGGGWQGLPSRIRANILIDDRPTVEHDYETIHPKLLMVSVGRTLENDPYLIDGFDRKLAKVAFNTALNARPHSSALRAIADQLKRSGMDNAHRKASELLQQLERRTPEMKCFFGTGVGVRLQRVDADLCATVQRSLRQKGIPVLSVHDSFISRRTSSATVREVMEDELHKIIRQLRRFGLGP